MKSSSPAGNRAVSAELEVELLGGELHAPLARLAVGSSWIIEQTVALGEPSLVGASTQGVDRLDLVRPADRSEVAARAPTASRALAGAATMLSLRSCASTAVTIGVPRSWANITTSPLIRLYCWTAFGGS